MYEEFFGLQRRPFSATPDANCFVPLETHQGVLDALAVSCERGQGIGVLTGDAGLGKSLVGLRLAFELHPTFATAFLGHSAYATRRALLQAILFELNRPYDRKAEQELRLDLAAALKSLRPEKQGFVLIVDEAHRLTVPLLDELRLLTLLADAGEPLTRVVLIGDRELEERLADPELVAFNQRVCCQVDLTPLTQAESLEYLSSNIELAGGDVEELFEEEALTFLAKAADGVPRCLNHLADHALLLAYVTERRPVSVEIVREALDDLKQLPLHWNDPVNGGEIYRGLSQRPPMEDSAVDLWPQREESQTDETTPADSWNEAPLAGSSAAIEIGGDLDEVAIEVPAQEPETVVTGQFTCLKENWEAIARPTESLEQLLENVTELTQAIEDEQGPPTLGQVFDAREFEFGAPSPQSFEVEEFAREEHGPDWRGEFTEERWTASADDEEGSEPVWNLPDRSWSENEDSRVEFEEEPVIDRYVRISIGASADGIVWNHHTPHAKPAAKRTVTAVKTTRLVMAGAASEDFKTTDETDGTKMSHESRSSSGSTISDNDSGIVESYSRRQRDVGQASNALAQSIDNAAADDHDHDENGPHEKRNWDLPRELLQATLADDGIEEQIGADVLDMYLDVRQSLLDRKLAEGRPTISLDKPNIEDPRSMFDEFEPTVSADGRGDRPEPPQPSQPDAIQRAYGRLFSELRRRKK